MLYTVYCNAVYCILYTVMLYTVFSNNSSFGQDILDGVECWIFYVSPSRERYAIFRVGSQCAEYEKQQFFPLTGGCSEGLGAF